MTKKLSVVIPIYNEQETIPELVPRIVSALEKLSYDYEVLFIDDGSIDQSVEILKPYQQQNNHLKIISFSRNFGHQLALTAGMNHASGDAVVIMDGDLQDPPEFIPTLVKHWEQGYDVVYAQRSKREGENWFKLVTAAAFYRLFRWITRLNMPLDTGDFRLMDKKVVAVYNSLSEKNPFIRGLISWVGFKQIGVNYDREVRHAGVTKFNVIKMMRFAMDGVISFSNQPLKFALRIGGFALLLSFAMIIYFLYSYLFGHAQLIQGWLSLITVILFFAGVQLFTIGIIGEYVSRIYDEVKNRPKYIVRNMTGFPDAGK